MTYTIHLGGWNLEQFSQEKLFETAKSLRAKGDTAFEYVLGHFDQLGAPLILALAKTASMNELEWAWLNKKDRKAVAWMRDQFSPIWDLFARQVIKAAFSGKLRLEIEIGTEPDGSHCWTCR